MSHQIVVYAPSLSTGDPGINLWALMRNIFPETMVPDKPRGCARRCCCAGHFRRHFFSQLMPSRTFPLRCQASTTDARYARGARKTRRGRPCTAVWGPLAYLKPRSGLKICHLERGVKACARSIGMQAYARLLSKMTPERSPSLTQACFHTTRVRARLTHAPSPSKPVNRPAKHRCRKDLPLFHTAQGKQICSLKTVRTRWGGATKIRPTNTPHHSTAQYNTTHDKHQRDKDATTLVGQTSPPTAAAITLGVIMVQLNHTRILREDF